jgi:hypothetical protein
MVGSSPSQLRSVRPPTSSGRKDLNWLADIDYHYWFTPQLESMLAFARSFARTPASTGEVVVESRVQSPAINTRLATRNNFPKGHL